MKNSQSQIKFKGTGPGHQTRDGCSVDFYLLLPAGNDPELIASQLAPGASILELGCGVGRVTHPLVQQGFQVTAVDNSPEMLASVEGAKTICADLEFLELHQTFDCVLLMSHMLNIPDPATRHALLNSCQRHLKHDGIVIIQCHNPAGFAKLKQGYTSEQNGMLSKRSRIT